MKKEDYVIYTRVAKAIQNYVTGSANYDSAKAQIREELGEKQYFDTIIQYLDIAIEKKDSNAKNNFINLFFDDLKSYAGMFIVTIMAMKISGLHDLIYLEFVKIKKSASKDFITDIDKGSSFNFLKSIYFHARYDIPILIVGETGTSKELLVETIHMLSDRNKVRLVEVNCATIPESLFESELFGVIPDYPGFHNTNGLTGKIEQANGGILFLDEIGRMSPQSQAKLLKAIEEKEITKLGGEESIRTNVRIIAATQPNNIDKILPDLKYRLGFPDIITMPTLKERISEAGEFVILNSFNELKAKMGMSDKLQIDKNCLTQLMHREYPGNYRELENILRGAMLEAIAIESEKVSVKNINIITAFRKEDAPDHKTTGPYYKVDSIKLKDIVQHADDIAKKIVETKVYEVLDSGRNLKRCVLEEGLPEKKYQNFLKKITTVTGKKVGDFKRVQ